MPDVEMVRTYQGLYRVLNHEGTWRPEVSAEYRASDCNGLRWRYKRRPTKRPLDVSGLRELPGLLFLYSSVRDADDSAVEALTDLQWLDLYTRSQQPLNLSSLTRLKTANIDDRPGLQGFPESLESLTLALSHRQDLRWLEGLGRLEGFKVEGSGQRLTLSGMPQLPNLQSMFLDQVLVDTGEQLDLPRLQVVNIYADQPDEADFDASVFVGCRALKFLRVRGPVEFRGLDALRSLPELEVVAVIGPKKPNIDFPQLRYVEWHGGRGR